MADASKRPADGPSKDSPAPKKAKKDKGGDDDGKKKKKQAENDLIKSLIEKDPELRRRFVKAMGEKPQGITNAAFVRQFWATRQHLLKAHAFELEQSRAMHNVFADIKPREDGKAGAAPGDESTKTLKLSPDQIEDMFRLHPIVRRAFNETVPKQIKDTRSFFQAFFTSRLFKKLKGERIRDEDRLDPVLDGYLEAEVRGETHVPHFIDLEGNEQNHSQRKGNQPDLTMRPGNSADKVVDILRAINTTSERILSNAAHTEGPAHQPVGVDEETYNQLRLHDLSADKGEQRILLNVKDQQQLHVGPSKAGPKSTSSKIPKTNPSKSLNSMQQGVQLKSKANAMDLTTMISFPLADDDDDEDDDDTDAATRNATTSLRQATAQIQALVLQQTDNAAGMPEASARNDMRAVAAALHMPEGTLQELVLTHQTTNEFLHYFWSIVVNAGTTGVSMDELAQAASALDNSVERMDAAAAAQEKVRQANMEGVMENAKKEQARLSQAGIKRKVVVDESEAGPGKQEVAWLMAPMAKAVQVAQARFKQLTAAAKAKAKA